MNKKQTIVLWILGILLIIISILSYAQQETLTKTISVMVSGSLYMLIPVLIIGGLLLYTLRNKK